MQPKTNRKKPDRIILFEIGLILALLFVNWVLNLEYTTKTVIDTSSKKSPFEDSVYVYTPPSVDPVVEPEPPKPLEKLEQASFFDPRAAIKQVENLFEKEIKKIGPPKMPKLGKINPIVIPPIAEPSNKVIDFAQVMPQFPGGDEALNKFIRNHLDIPDIVMENIYQVKMVVEFVIDKKGKVTDFKVIECSKPGMGLEEAAAYLYSKMPQWIPGQHDGFTAKVRLRQPINVVIH